MDGVAQLHMAARRIDDDADVAFALGIGQKLGGDTLGHLHVHFAEDQHGARFEQRLGDLGEDCGSGRLGLVVVFFVVFFVGAAQGFTPEYGVIGWLY